jgi:hypothetical protein
VVKEMKYRPKIGGGDFETKTRKVAQFLGEGHKVKITIMFRGREMQHPELGRRILDRVAAEVAEVGKVEIMPKQDGRNMTMVLGPDKKAQDLVKAQAKKASDAAAAADDVDESGSTAFDAGPEAPELVGTTATGALGVPDAAEALVSDGSVSDGSVSEESTSGDDDQSVQDEAESATAEQNTDDRAAQPAVVGDKN